MNAIEFPFSFTKVLDHSAALVEAAPPPTSTAVSLIKSSQANANVILPLYPSSYKAAA